MKDVYQKATEMNRPYVAIGTIKLSRVGSNSARLEARVGTEWQLECGHWSSVRDSYRSRKEGVDVYYCKHCTSEHQNIDRDLEISQEVAIDALVRMLERIGYKVEKP